MEEPRCKFCGELLVEGRNPNAKYCRFYDGDGSCFKERKRLKENAMYRARVKRQESEGKLSAKTNKRIKEQIEVTTIKWVWDRIPEDVTWSQMAPLG